MARQVAFNYLLMFLAPCLSVPPPTLQDRALMGNITRLCDNAIALESFKGSERETNPLYKDYHGKNAHTLATSSRLLSPQIHARARRRCIKAGLWMEAGQPPRRLGCQCALVCCCSIRRAPQ